MAVEKPCRRAEQIHVLVDLLDDSGSPNLDRDLAAVREKGTVDLRDRCRRDRLGIDPEEQIGIEVLIDHCFDLRERNRRHLVDEPAELLDVDIREQVGTAREQLSELDVRRPELLERASELARRPRA